jgi:predicted phosphodiesterase
VEALRPLIAGAGTVVFNGDTWEELARPFRGKAGAMLEDLRKLCAEEGAEAVFLSGNHGPEYSKLGWIELAGGRIIVTHGDAFLRGSSPWKREILTSADRIDEIWAAHPAAGRDVEERLAVAREIARELPSLRHSTGRRFLQRVWNAATPPARALRILEAWITQASAGAEFLQRYFPAAEVLIVGHFHWHGCWQRKDRLVINTGSFVVPGKAHWVEWNDGWLSRGCVNESRSPFRKGEILGVWRYGAEDLK